METTTGLREGEVTVAGVRSPYLEAGSSGATEAAVFVHGITGSSRDWEDLLARTGQFGRAVAPDVPGFGRADKPGTFEYTVGGYARHLGEFLEEIDVRKAHLVLHDFGGPWGLQWACEHPEAFASVALINTGVMPDYPLLGEPFTATATRKDFHLLPEHGNPRGLPKEFVDRMYDDFDAGTRQAVLKLYRTTNAAEVSRVQAEVLRPLKRPALVLWGAQDSHLPVRYAERQREVFSEARIVVLEESGHWPFVDDSESVADEVVLFLRRNLAAGGQSGMERRNASETRE